MKSYTAIEHSRIAVIALFFASTSSMSSAQQNAPPPWLDVTIVQVKGGMQLDFEDRVKELQAARTAGGMQPIQVFSVASGHPNEYHLVNPVQSLAAANSEAPPMQPAALASWFGRITSTVDNVRFFYAITYPQHGIQGSEPATPPELLVLRTTHVIWGKETEYENWIANQYMPAFRETNPMGHTMARGVFGDDGSNFYHAVPIANWAALDAGDPMQRQLGERRMEQMLNGLDGIVDSSELIVARIRYDLMGENQN